MPRTITGEFDIRREAKLAIERLVQEYDIDSAAIEVTAAPATTTPPVLCPPGQTVTARPASRSRAPRAARHGYR